MTGRIVAFDQTEFVPDKAVAANGLAKTGFLYAPKACEPGAAQPCRLQVALHGCTRSAEALGDVFLTGSASTSGPTGMENVNPDGCWNWWAYAGDAQYLNLTKKGAQINAIWKMMQRLEGK